MPVIKKTYKQSADQTFDEMIELYGNFQLPRHTKSEEAWKRLLTSIHTGNQAARQNTRSLKPYLYATAATILLLIGFTFMRYYFNEITISCQNAQNVLTTLPDGSTVKLNASSTIKYKRYGWKKDRTVYLKGEAFFKVNKGKTFEVITPNGKVTVLGTSFNVYARQYKLNVVCKTGKVLVEANNSVILLPGMKATTEKNRHLLLEKVNTEQETSWQHGEFWYNNAPLTEVFAEIERQFDVELKHSGLEQRKYTGYFNTQSLQNSLIGVCDPMQLHFKQKSDRYYIIY
jgi:transmembrane sensor